MLPNLTLFATIGSLLFAGTTQADIVRIDDYLVFNGTALQLDPVGHPNAVTIIDYFEHDLNIAAINKIYQKVLSEHPLSLRDGNEADSAATDCLFCMAGYLYTYYTTNTGTDSKYQAYDNCVATGSCTVVISTVLGNVPNLWTIAGLGAWGSTSNAIYNAWVSSTS
ncbi:hypothetical protein F5Y16DRAFT_312989 [Xylariaceae sp. FL0255]|nr:hypothetical protein F5Y16DRAFT_312989 [Xylariaceae sp. FL0255]